MSTNTLVAAAERIANYCRSTNRRRIIITLHGGEPTLLGAATIDRYTQILRGRLSFLDGVRFALQTNAVLITDDLVSVLQKQNYSLGVSVDGDRVQHDSQRIDHAGRGTYARVLANIGKFRAAKISAGGLCVIPCGHSSPLDLHRSLRHMGLKSIDYLLPDVDRASHANYVCKFGPTPVFDFLRPILDHWLKHEGEDFPVRLFRSMIRLVLGGSADVDLFGDGLSSYLFIESDGSYEPLDVLRVCADGMTRTNLNVFEHEIAECYAGDTILSRCLSNAFEPPDACSKCVEFETCRGGYLPHRFAREGFQTGGLRGAFNNRSVWCADLLALFGYLRARLDVNPQETRRRRWHLAEMGQEPV